MTGYTPGNYPTVTGQGTSFNLPNFTGELFNIAPRDTPLLTMMGGLGAGMTTMSRQYEWQGEGLETSSANKVALEGAPAPDPTEVARFNYTNTTEIHQESVSVSYTKLAATGQLNGLAIADASNPVTNELQHQLTLKLMKIAIDIEESFTSGVYALPANNSTPRQTCGLINAIQTNVFANGGTARAISKSIIDQALANMYLNGAPLPQETTLFLCHPHQRIALSNVYGTPPLNQVTFTRNIGGYSVDTLVTDFGTFGVATSRYMPQGQMLITDVSQLHPVFLDVPGKGHLFAEPLAKTGSFEQWQIYGEVGLMYGPETWHGLIGDLS
ncbi:SU10 major capsid protein [Mycobacterium malmoense]|uniref:SU10 major capsid protein n=1 Tax=Mycobacterium malmoense TaxID=1780 RepID=UPI0008F94C54|nr:DUF5309 family protein [Mycobacterium malmoense]OIN80875.1 hypothetical protein BMG05_11110 [Mycobacterium malmoense]